MFTSNRHIMAFLLMGQSNMAGRGDPASVEPITDDNILIFREDTWQRAVEPLHTTMPERDAVSLGMSFALELLESGVGASVGLIPCALGGTLLSRWEPAGDLYTIPFTACVSSEFLMHGGDNLHFDARFLREFGRRYARGCLDIAKNGGRIHYGSKCP